MPGEERHIGITTTVPVEIILAAGFLPVDLNNLFVFHPRRDELIERALEEGFPQSSCAWLKGIFGAVLEEGGPSCVVGVVRGDCSGTEVLLEALEIRGTEVIPFAYPLSPNREDMERELARFADGLGTTLEEAEEWRERLAPVRARLEELDRICWEENKVSGEEAHRWLVSSSDFSGDPESYGEELGSFIAEALGREPLDARGGIPFGREVRIGYVGVPPITPEIFAFAESLGARFVFHEVQRQFSMPTPPVPSMESVETAVDLAEQYLAYTYPYSVRGRAADINRQSEIRRLDGLIHYVQSFCHRSLEDVIFSRTLSAPMLTIECDCPGGLGATATARIENFIQVLGENQPAGSG